VEQDRNDLCDVDFLLVSSTGTSWKAASHPGILRALDVPGLGDKAPYLAEEIYEVPTSAATQLVGIALEDQTTPARAPVLRPLG
jgi:hypothetical protein